MTSKSKAACLMAYTALAMLGGHNAAWAGPEASVDSAALLTDVRILSSSEFGGRRTGTEGSRLAQAYILRRFEQLGIEPFGESYPKPFAFADSRGAAKTEYAGLNLIGQIRGTAQPDRYLVVSAHYDHLGTRNGSIYFGADDNASGVAAMLAVAAHFKRHRPRHTIIFAAFDGEELGHKGARAFIKDLPFPVAKIALNLNFDMVSRNDKGELYAAGTRYTPSLKRLVEMAATGSSVKLKFGHDSREPGTAPDYDWTGQSDHAIFHAAGVPFLYFGVEDHADYHKPGDTFDKIEPKFFGDVARFLVGAADVLDKNLGENEAKKPVTIARN